MNVHRFQTGVIVSGEHEIYPGVIKALEELQQYLSDQVPPMMVVDSIEVLTGQPPAVTASGIHSWLSGLHHTPRSIPVSDYLYHAVSKLHLLQEYKLVSGGYEAFLDGVKQEVLDYCPDEERPQLQQSLDRIGSNMMTPGSTPFSILIRPPGSEPVEASPTVAATQNGDMRSWNYIMSRLEKHMDAIAQKGGGAKPLSPNDDLVIETLAQTARTSRQNVEWKQTLGALRQRGVAVAAEDIFRSLGQTLPGWSIPSRSDYPLPNHSNLLAMHRLVSRADDRQEAATHFHHLVQAATERFNSGFLPQSAAMYRLAQEIIEKKEVEEYIVAHLLNKGHEKLSEEKLRFYADSPTHHALLRTVLNFYPAFTPGGLLTALYETSRRERRKLLLLMLESHGEITRTLCLEELAKPVPSELPASEVWYRRNLIYLLRRIPMPPEEPLERTVEILLSYSDLQKPRLILKEIVAYLPHLKHEKVERALRRNLAQLDTMLLKEPQQEDYKQLLDRTASALCRMDTAAGHLAAIQHSVAAAKTDPEAYARLNDLSAFDLTNEGQVLSLLLKALESNLPPRRMKLVLHQKDRSAKYLVQALSGTHHPLVAQHFEELAHKYPDCQSGQEANSVLAKWRENNHGSQKQESRGASLTGDLDIFGFPGLVQNLADSGVTGSLTLQDPDGNTFGTVALLKGRLKVCQTGQLTGEAAFFQLIEKPQSGSFQFKKALQPSTGSETGLPDVLSLILEGMSRYDELQQLRTQVPDSAKFLVKSPKPSCHPEEKDGLLFREIWTAVQNGANVGQAESAILIDSFRIRRLLAHWTNTGVIEPIES